jgi:hypothetical protein
VTYPTRLDPKNEVSLAYQLSGLPTTVFIRRDGTIVRTWLGALTEAQLTAFVEEIAQ